MRHFLLPAAAFVLISGIALGQSHGGMSASGGVRMAAPAASSHVVAGSSGAHAGAGTSSARIVAGGLVRAPAGVHLVVRNGQVHFRPSGAGARPGSSHTNHPRSVNPQDQFGGIDSNYPVPGLGFDAVHWAATHGQANMGRGRRPRQFAAFFPFFDGGFLVAPQTFVEDEAANEGSQAENAPQADGYETRQRGRYREQPEIIPAMTETEPQSQRESEQYVFVRRDGTIIFAVAYSWDKGNLRYVTNEGLRRSVAQDALDLDATRQFNEQRGLSFRLPA